MNLQHIRRAISDAGVLNTAIDLSLRIVNRFTVLKVIRAVKIEEVNPEFLTCDRRYHGLFLTRPMLRAFAENPEYMLTRDFLDQAFAKGDECYGFLSDDGLAAYGWYSSHPTRTDVPSLIVHFDPQYVYMYKAFTHQRHRGRRLHAFGVTQALEVYLARGFKGIVSYVDWNNFPSLKSSYRMGYSDIGRAWAARVGKHYFIHADRGCTEQGFRLELWRPKHIDELPILRRVVDAPPDTF